MDILEFREFCLSLPLAQETTPFDEDTLVYKVCGKMFAYTSISDYRIICVKCDPDKGVELRENYQEITPGFHMNKKHWISIDTTGDLPACFIKDLLRDSYRLVAKGLTKIKREELIAAVSVDGFEL